MGAMIDRPQNSADVLLHPQRFEIARVFEAARTLTVRELAGRLPDIPLSSLYRNVARMLEAGMLVATAERRPGFPRDVVYAFRDKPLSQADVSADPDGVRVVLRRVGTIAHDDLASYLDRWPDIAIDAPTVLHTYRRMTPDDIERVRAFARWIGSLPEDDDAPGSWNAITIARFPHDLSAKGATRQPKV